MNKSAAVWETLATNRLIALLNPKNPEQCVKAYEALSPLGVVLEVALRSEHAIPGLQAILEAHPHGLVLAGTVMTREQAESVLSLGVAGVVSADYVPGVVEECVASDVLCIPGGLSDVGKQLVQKAECYGQTLDELRDSRPWQWTYKVFPAMANPETTFANIKAWRAVYPKLTFVYTGGVDGSNVGWISSIDPDGIYCGSALTKYLDDEQRLVDEAKNWLGEIEGGREEATTAEPITRQTQGEGADLTLLSTSKEKATAPCIVTFGEIMMRLSPPTGHRFRRATNLDVTYGGSEANVAVSLALWGVNSVFVSAVPSHDIGQGAVDLLRSLNVDTSHVLRSGSRLGIYFLEHGASQRPSRVIYDRANSAIASIDENAIDWEQVFHGANWLHWSGITPALSEKTAIATAKAVKAAKTAGMTVSVDLNYRSKLWSKERARAVMTPLMEYVDVVIANEADAADVFGVAASNNDPETGKIDAADYEFVARTLVERFDLTAAAITLRESHSASDNTWSACLFDGDNFYHSRSYPIHLVDRVGGGDAFSAGLIYGLATGKNIGDALEYGVAASCLKQTIVGDFNLVSSDEVESLAKGPMTGRIKR